MTDRTEQIIEDANTAIRIHDGVLALKAENERLAQALYVSNEQRREAERRASAAEDGLRALVRFAASVWYDEGNCSAEEEEAMYAARVALSKL